MGQTEVERIRQLFERWALGEFATPEFFDPDIEYLRIGSDVPGTMGHWHGLKQMWESVAAYLRVWEALRNVPEAFIDLGDSVLVLDRQIGRGKRSGITVDHPMADLFTLRDGLIVRLASYWHRDEALTALEPAAAALVEREAGDALTP